MCVDVFLCLHIYLQVGASFLKAQSKGEALTSYQQDGKKKGRSFEGSNHGVRHCLKYKDNPRIKLKVFKYS